MEALQGKVAVVTGGTSGIGRAIALRFARTGARVWIGDVQLRAENDSLFEEHGIRQCRCDVRREEDVRELIRRAVSEAGQLDVMVNNAGVGLVKPITEVTEEEWNRCLDTNLKGAFFGCKWAIPVMRPRGGSIINMSSNAGLLPRAHDPVYSTSKAALIALTRSLALSHSPDRIRVNAICPGPVGDTGMMNADLQAADDPQATAQQFINASPLARAFQRMITPDEVAEAALYLASDAAVMVTGTAIAIDGGKSLGVPPAG